MYQTSYVTGKVHKRARVHYATPANRMRALRRRSQPEGRCRTRPPGSRRAACWHWARKSAKCVIIVCTVDCESTGTSRTSRQCSCCTLRGMDVAIADLRAHLSDWLERARAGTEVIITDRGLPVARLLGLETTSAIERLTIEGVIGRPDRGQRPVASGRQRPRPRRPVADLVSEQRD